MAKIAIVDDDPITRLILQTALEQAGHQVILAENGREGLQIVGEQHPEIVICDWMMPEMDGLELCRRIKGDRDLHTIFLILLTSREQVEDRVRGLDSGADEFLSKPIDAQELKARIRAGLRLQNLTTALKQANDRLRDRNRVLESLCLTDELTGTLNRRAFDQTLERFLFIARSDRLCLFMLDLDRFKQINDTHGHPVGDRVLQTISQRLLDVSVSNSWLYRYGGEEFSCIATDLNLQETVRLGEFLRKTVADTPVSISDDLQLSVTISIGGVLANTTSLNSSDKLVAIADRALYQAKAEGRNCLRLLDVRGNNLESLILTTHQRGESGRT